jgi:hypothetical protein
VNRGVFRKYRSGDQLYQRSGITQCGWEFQSRVSASTVVDSVAFLLIETSSPPQSLKLTKTDQHPTCVPTHHLAPSSSTPRPTPDCALRSGLPHTLNIPRWLPEAQQAPAEGTIDLRNSSWCYWVCRLLVHYAEYL